MPNASPPVASPLPIFVAVDISWRRRFRMHLPPGLGSHPFPHFPSFIGYTWVTSETKKKCASLTGPTIVRTSPPVRVS